MSTAAPVLKRLRVEVLQPVEYEMLKKNVPGNFSIQRSCGSNRSLDSYHMSIQQLRQCGSSKPYSLRTDRDKSVIGTEDEIYACGIDIKFPGAKLRAFSKAMVEIVQTNPSYARDIREIVYSPDGKVVMRWDAQRGMASEPRSGEADNSHLWHTHLSQYRDAVHRMGTFELVVRALERCGIITEERMNEFLGVKPEPEPEPEPEETVESLSQVIELQRGTALADTPVLHPDTLAEMFRITSKVTVKVVGITPDGKYRGIHVNTTGIPGTNPKIGLVPVEKVTNLRVIDPTAPLKAQLETVKSQLATAEAQLADATAKSAADVTDAQNIVTRHGV